MLFGTEAPKMIVNLDTTNDEVLLDYVAVLKDEPEPDLYSVKAPRTGKKVFTKAGKHWLYQIKMHLWKYVDPGAKYLELKSYEGTETILYRHSDVSPMLDQYGNEGVFILQSINESYTDDYNKKDVLVLTFKSKERIYTTIIPPVSDYDVGYLMNLVTDTPQGSITSTVNSSGKLYDIKNIGTPPNYYDDKTRMLYANGIAPITVVNGFNALRLNNGYSLFSNFYFRAYTYDVLQGVLNLTVVAGFKSEYVNPFGSNRTIFNHYNDAGDVRLCLRLNKTGKVEALMENASGSNQVSSITSLDTYADNGWHIAIAVFKQSNKTVNLFTEKGESKSTTNGAFVQNVLSTTKTEQPQIGYTRTNAGGLSDYFGSREGANDYQHDLGDILFFFKALSNYDCNKHGGWVASRFGITWSNI